MGPAAQTRTGRPPRSFNSAGRASCLHAVIGAHDNRYMPSQDVNAILSNHTIE